MSNNYKPIVDMSEKDVPNMWIFNIRQDNWTDCKEGPSNGGHGSHNSGEPWHGIKRGSRRPGASRLTADISQGDIAFARRAVRNSDGSSGTQEHGVMGIWRCHETSRVLPSMHIPWDGGVKDYKKVIYCRAEHGLPRDFNKPLTENFSRNSRDAAPFDQTEMQDSLKYLDKSERGNYVEHLVEHNSNIPDSIQKSLKSLIRVCDGGI